MKKWYDEEYEWEIEVIGFRKDDKKTERLKFASKMLPQTLISSFLRKLAFLLPARAGEF